jgi:hypothetical protein
MTIAPGTRLGRYEIRTAQPWSARSLNRLVPRQFKSHVGLGTLVTLRALRHHVI